MGAAISDRLPLVSMVNLFASAPESAYCSRSPSSSEALIWPTARLFSLMTKPGSLEISGAALVGSTGSTGSGATVMLTVIGVELSVPSEPTISTE
ncbi:hypothetical protein D3C87_1609200 [compost metagenome]